jgi:hypothetical protein
MLRDFVVGHHLYFTHDVNLYLTNFFFAFLQHPLFFLCHSTAERFFLAHVVPIVNVVNLGPASYWVLSAER